jgi:hypothetical protein
MAQPSVEQEQAYSVANALRDALRTALDGEMA